MAPTGPLYDYSPDVVADPQQELLPVQQYDYVSPDTGRPRVVIESTPAAEIPTQVSGGGIDGTVSGPQLVPVDHDPFATVKKIGNRLLGINGEERYQTWPEKLIRSGVTAAGDALSGQIPQYEVDPNTGDVHTSFKMIERAMDMSSVAGTGGLGGVGNEAGVALGSTPFLRPALKYEGKIYKAPMGGQHLDALPEHLQDTFQKQAMSGDDISNFNFGFMNEKGKFLNREQALEHGINTGLIDPQAGKYGALTSTLLADSSKPGTAIEAMAKTNAPIFYSALEHNVEQIKQPKMTGDQWLGTLSNKPGVKPEELQWTGLGEFLKENAGKPVTKEQIQEHLNNNKVELKEVQKGGSTDPYIHYMKDSGIAHELKTTEDVSLAKTHNSNFRETFKGLSDEEILKLAKDAEGLKNVGETKYHSYQLPGGENYREMLMTLPEVKRANTFDNYLKDYRKRFPNADSSDAEVRGFYDKGVQVPGEGKLSSKIDPDVYKSSHWDEPNILAHVRMNDRTMPVDTHYKVEGLDKDFKSREEAYAARDAAGLAGKANVTEHQNKKSLHLEEIQSDWHQQGRDKGYRGEQEKQLENLVAQRDAIKDQQLAVLKKHGVTVPTGEARTEWLELADKLSPIQTKINQIGMGEVGVPDAPFKKTWHELALKRMIREAAENGYDRLSWTPGEAQAARYDLSKSVGKVIYSDQAQHLMAYDHNGNAVINKMNTEPKDLPNLIGKEAAEKLLKSNETEKLIGGKYNKLEGQDLKIGGEGMKGFYDNIIPKALEKLGKEHGVKVKQTLDPNAGEKFAYINKKSGNKGKVFNSQDEAKAWLKDSGLNAEDVTLLQVNRHAKEGSKFEPLHYIDIPQSLKDVVMKKGQALFSAGVPLTPIDHDPFEKKKKK